VAELADYLDLTVSQARQQFRELKLRSPVSSGRQAIFLPVETLLCLAVSFQINHRRYGGSTAHLAPEPIPSLARLFSRPSSSILAKMANLDGSRSHGGKYDILAGAVLRDEPAHFTHIYRTLLTAARAEGINQYRLPDFLGLEHRQGRRRRYLDRAADRAHPAGRGPGRAAPVHTERAGQLRRAVRVLRAEPRTVRP
jgi:putative restriction endonuclease